MLIQYPFRDFLFNRQYMNGKGERTLRAYSRPVNLRVVYGGVGVGVGINLVLPRSDGCPCYFAILLLFCRVICPFFEGVSVFENPGLPTKNRHVSVAGLQVWRQLARPSRRRLRHCRVHGLVRRGETSRGNVLGMLSIKSRPAPGATPLS